MRRLKELKEKTRQKWHDLPHHHRLAITAGVLITILLIGLSINLLNRRLKAAVPNIADPLIFRTIVEERQPKQLIIRGINFGSRGKTCFAKEGSTDSADCPVEFPVIAWSHTGVRAKVTTSSPTSGQVWLITGEGRKSNSLKISF